MESLCTVVEETQKRPPLDVEVHLFTTTHGNEVEPDTEGSISVYSLLQQASPSWAALDWVEFSWFNPHVDREAPYDEDNEISDRYEDTHRMTATSVDAASHEKKFEPNTIASYLNKLEWY